ncbi:MerR family transcriptional regulator [Paracoccus sp. PXZ]|uniref:MerR family transcriptional regulator n=1 Tax=Pseudochrobactrum sp. B5 TaxID=1289478 RepID=UPI000952908B|nr:MerR family transcriptional regulator [Pseudochrobactrum sp. B5]
MHSKDIARLAGVSVRTLRHYHQTGILAEPDRKANGYRLYGWQHLVRLLRIRQLTALGLPLSDIPTVLDGQKGMDMSTLDALDDSLACQITVLERQRQMVASLREGRAPFDIPPELAAPLLALEAGRSAAALKAGREQSVLFGHMVDEEGRKALASLYERLNGPDLAPISLELGQRFDALGPHSAEDEISSLVESYMGHLGPWLREFEAVLQSSAVKGAGALLWTHAMEASNLQQQRMLARLSSRVDGRI